MFQKNRAGILYAVFLALGIGVSVFLVILYFHHQASKPTRNLKNSSLKRYPKASHEIRGFRFEDYNDGQKTILIKADKFSIQKKKVGFFSFGMMNEAIFDNAIIHIYGRKQHTEDTATPDAHKKTQSEAPSNIKNLTFNAISLKNAISSFNTKNISSVLIKPVSIKLYDGKLVVTQITANLATVRLKPDNIFFKGNVKVVSGNKILNAKQLSLNIETAVIKVKTGFKLKTSEKEWKGEHLITNIFLGNLVKGQTIVEK